jgi:hypothetical protein
MTLQVPSAGVIVQHMNDSTNDRLHGRGRGPQQAGPPLAALAGISLGLLLIGLVIGAALGGVPPVPYGSSASVLGYLREHPDAVRVAAVFTFGSSVPLVIYAATASARLRQLGVTAPGATIALAGGLLAAGGLGLSSLFLWTLSQADVRGDDALVRALYFLVYLTGGPGHIVMLGLLLAGIAVPVLILGLVPRPVAWTGLGIAVIAELTTLVLIWPALSPLLPIARFAGLVWLIVAGALMPLRRANRNEALHAKTGG